MQETDNKNIVRKPRLVIRVGRQSLSFSALDSTTEGKIIFEPYTIKSGISMAANLREALKEINLELNNWQRAVVLVDSPVLMVPVDIFDEQTKTTLYNHAITGFFNNFNKI